MSDRGVALYIDPFTHHFLDDRLFAPETNPFSGDSILAPYLLLREHFVGRGIPVHTADRLLDKPVGGRNVYVSLGYLDHYRRIRHRPDTVLSAFVAMECPNVEPTLYRALPEVSRHFRRMLSWSDGEALERWTGRRLAFERYFWPQSYDRVHEPIWSRHEREGFLVMINANKLMRLSWGDLCIERLRAVAFFQRHGEIDLYGKNWDTMPYRVGRTRVPATLRRWWRQVRVVKQRLWPDPLYVAAAAANRGTTRDKAGTLGRYRFAICFENQVLKGWITEKLFDCFFAGTVPVYWGAPDITDHVPPETFIDMRRFGGYAELREFLHGLGPNDIVRYKEAARAFLASDRFRPFRKEAFLEHFRRFVREDAGVDA